MLKSIFKSKDLSDVRSISHGKSKEKVARTIYFNNMLKKVPNFAVYDVGLSVHSSFPCIGATPAGKVYDPSENPPYGLLEIKCPFSKRKGTFVQASSDGTFYLEEKRNSFYLKRNHTCGYFVQIQGSLESQASSSVTFVFISLNQMR